MPVERARQVPVRNRLARRYGTSHDQLVTGKKLAEVGECFEAGKPFVVNV
jgi:hypothetical protein